MGRLPESRLKSAPPFNYTMVDLFGPYEVRGEVQKRTKGKAYGVISPCSNCSGRLLGKMDSALCSNPHCSTEMACDSKEFASRRCCHCS